MEQGALDQPDDSISQSSLCTHEHHEISDEANTAGTDWARCDYSNDADYKRTTATPEHWRNERAIPNTSRVERDSDVREKPQPNRARRVCVAPCDDIHFRHARGE